MPQRPLFTETQATRSWVRDAQRVGRRVGLVPTMGALHEGHLSLVRAAAEACDTVLASVFVNPTQFAPSEDYHRYPRDLESDQQMLADAGCDAVFAPAVDTMYPEGFATEVRVGDPAVSLEGADRPEHFSGVATVLAKLFSIAPADAAFFGQKDYQQTVVVRRLVADLNLPIEVVVCPTVREADGLALSSRNAYLSPDERRSALALRASLRAAEQAYAGGERAADRLRQAVRDVLEAEPGVAISYVEVVRDGTVEPIESLEAPAVVLVAARVGQTRLIDNLRLP